MTPCSTSRSNASGFTLIELMITITILSMVVTALCYVFIANQKAFERQTGFSSALFATNTALSMMSDYVSNAKACITINRFGSNDALCIRLPVDSAYGVYVPTLVENTFDYVDGQKVVFYLSNSTGSYGANGNILWAGTTTSWGFPSAANVTPDSSWSLYPSSTQGRIAPIASLSFTELSNVKYEALQMTVTATYKAGTNSTNITLSRTRTICLRSKIY